MKFIMICLGIFGVIFGYNKLHSVELILMTAKELEKARTFGWIAIGLGIFFIGIGLFLWQEEAKERRLAPQISGEPGSIPQAHTQPSASNYCSECGVPLKATQKFCSSCGTQVQSTPS